MNKRDKAILDWVSKNRPDCLEYIKEILKAPGITADGYRLLLFFGFESGRQFQFKTQYELDNPNMYLKKD